MKLWLLRPVDDLPAKNPWAWEYDKAHGFVVRAETEEQARQTASGMAYDEGSASWHDGGLSTCVELTTDGPAELIMVDFRAG